MGKTQRRKCKGASKGLELHVSILSLKTKLNFLLHLPRQATSLRRLQAGNIRICPSTAYALL